MSKKSMQKRLMAILVVSIMVIAAFVTISASMASAQSYSIPQTPANGFKYIGDMNSNSIVTATVYVPLVNTSLLSYYTQEISTPGSPMFHQFMLKQKILSMFTDQKKYNQVLNYIKSKNLKIQEEAMNSIIVFSATVSQMKQFFGMNVGLYSNGTFTYYNAYGTPSINGVYVYATNMTKLFYGKPSTLISPNDINAMKAKFSQVNQVFSIEPYYPTWLQSVYNATGMYSKGIMGQKQTIGILDYAGDPYIQEQLDYFDSLFGLPNVQINITSIGPYNPYLGIAVGWAGEISLDVEISHTMAPLANITLYIANWDYSTAQAIAAIDQYDSVNVLSQSFSISESYIANFPAIITYLNVILPDYFYMMGSMEGITFLASSGDAGGAGYSAGTLGTVGYPATSPFVTSIGGTTAYVTINNEYNVTSWYQTAWSNYGFVPPFQNYGGSTGGISMLEALPWYQANVKLPSPSPVGYTNGRLVPDVSFEAAVFPGTLFVFPFNQLGISGGTSEASPLFAGLLTLTDQYIKERAGLINPALYAMGENSSLYSKVFEPITYGYNIPWVNTYGYNLVTGFGSLNIGAFSYYLNQMLSSVANQLDIQIFVLNPPNATQYPYEFPDGSTIMLAANITDNGHVVSAGTFYAYIESLQGNSNEVSLTYNSTYQLWLGAINVPENNVGIGYLYVLGSGYVTGSSSEIQGLGFEQIFLGYYLTYGYLSNEPYLVNIGMPLYAMVSWINGTPVQSGTLNFTVYSYSILNNTYYSTMSIMNVPISDGIIYAQIYGNMPTGVSLLAGNDAYGYFPFYNGVDLQDSLILGPVVVEPGAVAPGSDIMVEAVAIPPVNIPYEYSYVSTDVFEGSNITFTLVNSQGQALSSVSVPYGTWMELPVPSSISSGLYTIMITSSYFSYSFDEWINGTFFGQIFVSSGQSTPSVTVTPNVVYEGQNVLITASITANGKPVKYGMYTVTIYPESLNYTYNLITNYEQIYLYYDTDLGMWVGFATMPSEASSNSLSVILNGPYYWPGLYDVLPVGISANGVPTITSQASIATIVLKQGPELVITSPSNNNLPYATSSTINITGETTATSVSVNNVNAPVVNGVFTVQENLVQGLNVFNIVATDANGYSTSQIVTVLYLPQILTIQSQLNQISNEISNLQNQISSSNSNLSALKYSVASLSNQLISLKNEVNLLNSTYGVKLSNLTSEINNLQDKLNITSTKISQVSNSSSSGISTSSTMAIAALLLALIAIIIGALSFFRRPKNPVNTQEKKEGQ